MMDMLRGKHSCHIFVKDAPAPQRLLACQQKNISTKIVTTKDCTNEVDMSLAGLIAQKDPQWDRQ